MNRLFVLCATLACAAGNRETRSQPKPPPSSFDVKAVDEWVASRVADDRIPGASLAVMRDGQLVLVKGYGVAPETPFGIGSVTKQFTCAAALLLAEDGKLRLDRKVAADYPSLTRAGDITLMDLFQHVSGYPDYYPLDFVDRRMLHDIAPDELIARYATGPLDFEPGTRWSYSNTGYIIAGRMVERAAGMPIGKLFEDHLFRPAGMTKTSWAGAATGYTSFALGAPEPAMREPEGWLYTAGGILSTAADLTRWDLALMDGKILKPESWRAMTTARRLVNGRSTDYACGLGVSDRSGETVYVHTGAVSGFLAYNAFIPRTRSAVAFLVDRDDVEAAPIARQIVDLLVKDESPPPKVAGPPPREIGLQLLHQLQQGRLDRTLLGAEFDWYVTPARLAGAAGRLRPLGEPESIDVENVHERGGMEVSLLRFNFASESVRASLYRTPDGKVQQFLLYR